MTRGEELADALAYAARNSEHTCLRYNSDEWEAQQAVLLEDSARAAVIDAIDNAGRNEEERWKAAVAQAKREGADASKAIGGVS